MRSAHFIIGVVPGTSVLQIPHDKDEVSEEMRRKGGRRGRFGPRYLCRHPPTLRLLPHSNNHANRLHRLVAGVATHHPGHFGSHVRPTSPRIFTAFVVLIWPPASSSPQYNPRYWQVHTIQPPKNSLLRKTVDEILEYPAPLFWIDATRL